MINCPERSFVYNAEKFIETANRGPRNEGEEYQLIGIHEVVNDDDSGQIGYIDPVSKQIATHTYSSSSSSNTEISTAVWLTYDFNGATGDSADVTDLILYDFG